MVLKQVFSSPFIFFHSSQLCAHFWQTNWQFLNYLHRIRFTTRCKLITIQRKSLKKGKIEQNRAKGPYGNLKGQQVIRKHLSFPLLTESNSLGANMLLDALGPKQFNQFSHSQVNLVNSWFFILDMILNKQLRSTREEC